MFSLQGVKRKLVVPGLAFDLVIGLHPAALLDQRWQPQSGTKPDQLEPATGEITIDEAVAACEKFLAKIGMRMPQKPLRASRLPKPGRLGGDVSFGGDAGFIVDAKSGEVTYFDDYLRQERHRTGELQNGPLRLDNPLTARIFGIAVMERIGLPPECKVAEMRMRSFTERERSADPTAYPRVDFVFQKMPYGIRIDSDYGQRYLSLDALDGSVVCYSRYAEVPYEIETHAPVLTLKEAKAKFEPIAKKFMMGREEVPEGAPLPKPRRAELRFVVPNGVMGGIKYDWNVRPLHMRLAWAFIYEGLQAIWIDAVDGRLLGGYRPGG